MNAEVHAPEARDESLDRRHEYSDPPVHWILFAGGVVGAMMGVSFLTVWIAMAHLTPTRPLNMVASTHGVIVAPDDEPLERFPEPSLQVAPHAELVATRASEERLLNTYGWEDRKSGIVRIPIERAMDLTIERGLPVRPASGPPSTGQSSIELIKERSENR